MKELAALRERVRYLEEVEKEFATLARELKDSETKYRFLVDRVQEAVLLVQDDTVKSVNPAAKIIGGYSADELGSVPFPEFIDACDRDRVLAIYRQALAGETSLDSITFGVIRKGGEVFQATTRFIRVNWEDRPAVLCLLQDATRQGDLESQLLYAKKMEAVGTLAGGIAHDFNNHLQGISGYIQLLMMRGDRDRTEQGWLLQMERSVKRAAALTKQLLIFSRKEESRLEPIDLNEVVRQAQKTLARTIPESITAELRLAAELPSVDGDAVQLEHVLFNLGINAKDAMPDGGKIVIETRNVQLDEAFCRNHVGVTPGAYVELTFADSGHGMDRETLERIFEPFYTTKGWALPSSTASSRATTGSSCAKAILIKGRPSAFTCRSRKVRGQPRRRRSARGATTAVPRPSSSSTTSPTFSISARTPSSSSATRFSRCEAARRPSRPIPGRGIASTWSFSIWGCRGWAGRNVSGSSCA
jgi:two-component system cell cycle sensor histidine kinase/response regulator CckA